ncbi:MAG: transketolase [Cytophagales bacterium]|nr:transketolase [Cytophagales bacterium]
MRKYFSDLIEKKAKEDEKIVFITGDLGYNALENLQDILKDRFINAGVAEQNMVGIAAGMAYKGYKVFCYSIAPFMVYRTVEQIRLDVCLHKLPVFVVGNGGGYGYGIMGATHHAIEDLACLSAFPNINCWVPAFKSDVSYCVDQLLERNAPAYLRLGAGFENPFKESVLGDLMKVNKVSSPKLTVIALGPVINNLIPFISKSSEIDLFAVIKLPFASLTKELIESIQNSRKVLIVEEHMQRGGIAEHISVKILEAGLSLTSFKSVFALGYPNGRYGSQNYHQTVSSLDSKSLEEEMQKLLISE